MYTTQHTSHTRNWMEIDKYCNFSFSIKHCKKCDVDCQRSFSGEVEEEEEGKWYVWMLCSDIFKYSFFILIICLCGLVVECTTMTIGNPLITGRIFWADRIEGMNNAMIFITFIYGVYRIDRYTQCTHNTSTEQAHEDVQNISSSSSCLLQFFSLLIWIRFE